MNDDQKISYAKAHPAESGRISKISAHTSGICMAISLRYHTLENLGLQGIQGEIVVDF
jgi:hypothetical protein